MTKQIDINWNDPLNQEIEIYLKYRTLEAKDLSKILNNIDVLYEKILGITSPVYVKNNIPIRNFLEISNVSTGNSITIKFKEGWKPELSFEEGHFFISLPKKLGVPILVISLLFSAIQSGTEIYNDILDAQLKKIEIELKEHELKQKLDAELSKYGGNKSITYQVNKTIRYFIENDNFLHVEINHFPIKTQNNQPIPPEDEHFKRRITL